MFSLMILYLVKNIRTGNIKEVVQVFVFLKKMQMAFGYVKEILFSD